MLAWLALLELLGLLGLLAVLSEGIQGHALSVVLSSAQDRLYECIQGHALLSSCSECMQGHVRMQSLRIISTRGTVEGINIGAPRFC